MSIKKFLITIVLLSLFFGGITYSATLLFPYQGGLGTGTVPSDSQIPIGAPDGLYDVKTLTAGNNITISSTTNSLTIASTGGGSGGSNWQFTLGESAIRPTSTVGIIVSASSTFVGDLTVGVSKLFIDADGNVGISTSTPTSLFSVGGQVYTSATTTATGLVVRGTTATSTITIGTDTKPGCLKIQDTIEAGGWTYCRTNAGTLTCSIVSCE